MPELTELTAHIARLATTDFSRSSEPDTRERAVNPVIGALGWNVYDENEVDREYSVRGGRVDYCLRAQARNLVLVEVKRAGTDLTEHQEQLLRYAFDESVPLAVLTDGLVWWLYLPTAQTNWEQRLFFRINVCEQAPSEAALALYRFLNRNNVVSGDALLEAKHEFDSQERDRSVRAALQEAWHTVLRDPDSLLREELVVAVEEISGHRPDPITITDFLLGMLGIIGETGRVLTIPTTPAVVGKQTQSSDKKGNLVYGNQSVEEFKVSGRKSAQARTVANRSVSPVGFWLDGESHKATTHRQVLVRLCELLAKQVGSDFNEQVFRIRGRTRPYFSGTRHELYEGLPISDTGLYVEGNVSGKLAETIARRTLREIRGTDNGFHIDLAEPPQTK